VIGVETLVVPQTIGVFTQVAAHIILALHKQEL
jgi:hypothetical protein